MDEEKKLTIKEWSKRFVIVLLLAIGAFVFLTSGSSDTGNNETVDNETISLSCCHSVCQEMGGNRSQCAAIIDDVIKCSYDQSHYGYPEIDAIFTFHLENVTSVCESYDRLNNMTINTSEINNTVPKNLTQQNNSQTSVNQQETKLNISLEG